MEPPLLLQSPDGASVAYISKENRGFVVRVRRDGIDGSTALTKSTSDRLSQLSFTQDGRFITFVSYPSSQPSMRSIHMIPMAGGVENIVPETFAGPVGLARDGTQAAYLATNDVQARSELWIQRTDGSRRRLLASLPYPSRFTYATVPAWSNDGTRIACGVEAHDKQGFFIRIVVVNTASGEMREVPSLRWQVTQHFAWAKGDAGLAIVGQEQDSSFQQIWYIRYPGGEARRITNDLNDYSTISLDSSSTNLVSVQVQTLSNIYLQQGEQRTLNPTQITIGSGRYFDLSWAADGGVLYASDATGSADLWVMNADGSNQRQLTSGRGAATHRLPRLTANGSRSTQMRTAIGNLAGPGRRRQSNSADDKRAGQQLAAVHSRFERPRLSPYGGRTGMWNIWRVPVTGGPAVQLTRSLTTHPTLSPKDGKIACWYSTSVEKPNWQLAVFPPTGGEPIRTFPLASTVVPDSNIRWSPSGRGITFLDGREAPRISGCSRWTARRRGRSLRSARARFTPSTGRAMGG